MFGDKRRFAGIVVAAVLVASSAFSEDLEGKLITEGKNQFINTVEYRFLLMEPRPFSLSFFTAYIGLQLAAFGDFGHTWNESNDFAVNQFIGGYGVGLRVLIPFVDEIRMDVAWGAPGEGITFHFGIYPKVVMQRERVR